MRKLFPVLLLALAGCGQPTPETAAPPAAKAITAAEEPQDRDVEDPVPAPPAPKAPAMGRISGALSYPSDYIPEDMQVVAVPVTGGPDISNAIKAAGVYTMELPVGEYYVYAITKDDPGHKAYYNEFVTCGLNVNCPSHTIIKVPVRAGQTTTGVDPQDWYDQQ